MSQNLRRVIPVKHWAQFCHGFRSYVQWLQRDFGPLGRERILDQQLDAAILVLYQYERMPPSRAIQPTMEQIAKQDSSIRFKHHIQSLKGETKTTVEFESFLHCCEFSSSTFCLTLEFSCQNFLHLPIKELIKARGDRESVIHAVERWKEERVVLIENALHS